MASDSPAFIDLHIHSTASDGTLSPAEIIRTAQKTGLSAISITDHDTLAGAGEALGAGIPASLGFVTGVEISTDPPSQFSLSGSMHLLGYGIRLDDAGLNTELTKLQEARANRNPRIVHRLNQLGFALSYESLLTSCDGQLSRPHIAQQLVEKGYISSIDEAFDKYLGNGRPAYVDKYHLNWHRAIQVIRESGGLAVLAHPCLLDLPNEDALEKLIVILKSAGLGGIEVYYPEHTVSQTERFRALALRHRLKMTGGTDFHGAITPGIEMGIGKGDFFIPYSLYENLMHTP
ncbi:MAG: PHP domain-containing protein [Pseudomonadota bacterium]